MQFNINGQIFELSEISVDFLEKYLQRVRKYIDKNNLESDLYLDIQERISEKFSELSKPISNKKVIDIINEI
jgi:ribosome-associated translation inhibitor RaiA